MGWLARLELDPLLMLLLRPVARCAQLIAVTAQSTASSAS